MIRSRCFSFQLDLNGAGVLAAGLREREAKIPVRLSSRGLDPRTVGISVPWMRCLAESKTLRFFVAMTWQIPLCLSKDSILKVRKHIGHGRRICGPAGSSSIFLHTSEKGSGSNRKRKWAGEIKLAEKIWMSETDEKLTYRRCSGSFFLRLSRITFTRSLRGRHRNLKILLNK